MTTEEQVKSIIIQKYKSVRAFTQAIDIPYSTIDSMLKKGISGTGIQTVMKVCHALEIDIESIQTGKIKNSSTTAQAEMEEYSEDERNLINNYRMLNDVGKSKVSEDTESMTYNPKYKKSANSQFSEDMDA